MLQTPGKNTARDILYREYLTNALTPIQIRSAAILLLLGEEPREIPYLDAFGVQHNRIYSIENDLRVYNIQRDLDLGIHLRYQDMKKFLMSHLRKENRFAFLNLDIEGTFRHNLDPSLTEVLLYCLWFPETAVATYTTVGHDEYMLFEGIYSLAILLWLAPDETEECIATLEKRYAEAGYENAFSLVLRDLFWIRSHMEHACAATCRHGMAPHEHLNKLLSCEAFIWAYMLSFKKTPMRFDALQKAIGQLSTYSNPEKRAVMTQFPYCGIHISDLRHLIYRGDHVWSQKCYFAKFENISTNPMELRLWVVETLRRFVETPLTFIDQKGYRKDYDQHEDIMYGRSIIWYRKSLYTKFKPREISLGT
ncbi:hypothetical protein HYW94_03740 [Candidatus Uhrbacteria bacterium]|nr:hypothetical protein [Candidatus Uhrbacteria bacterium]